MRHMKKICVTSLGALAGWVLPVSGAVTVDGTLSPGEYGANTPGTGALSTQTINTGFGDSTVGDGSSGGGSELDASYGIVQNGNLYVFLAGNVESNGNNLNVFISDGRAGQSTLALPGVGTTDLSVMNGSTFSPGFLATYALNIVDSGGVNGTDTVEEYTYSAPNTLTGGVVGTIALTGGIGNGKPGVATIGYNDTNVSAMTGSQGTTTSSETTALQATKTGIEIGIPLSALGNPAPGSNILILADINGGGATGTTDDSYLSNQFLPGLAVGTTNLGGGGAYTGPNGGTFNFSGIPGEYFSVTVPVPEPATFGLMGGLTSILLLRRRTH
jgi:hypothetical protein